MQDLLPLILGFITGLISVIYLTPYAIKFSKKRSLYDHPTVERKIHSSPIPRIGGIAIVIAFYLGLAVTYFSAVYVFDVGHLYYFPNITVLLGCFALAMVGLWDDIKNLDFKTKMLIQALVILGLVLGGIRLEEMEIPFYDTTIHFPPWIAGTVSFVWMLGLVNAINFLDGLDGLASGVLVIIFGSLSWSFFILGIVTQLPVAIVITGVLIGFLKYNFNPAKIFMGDSGSLFLGLLLATYSISHAQRATSVLAICIPLIAMGLPLLDTTLAVVRRTISGVSPFKADREHIHHKITDRLGLTHRNTVIVLYVVSIVFGVFAMLLAMSQESAWTNVKPTLIVICMSILVFLFLKKLGYLNRIRKP